MTKMMTEGGFSLSQKFYIHTDVNLAGFTYVKKKSKRHMNGLCKRKKLSVVQLFNIVLCTQHLGTSLHT